MIFKPFSKHRDEKVNMYLTQLVEGTDRGLVTSLGSELTTVCMLIEPGVIYLKYNSFQNGIKTQTRSYTQASKRTNLM